MKDLANSISVVQSLAPAVRTADANGTGVDLQGFEGATVVVVGYNTQIRLDVRLPLNEMYSLLLH